jgi:hypothetical protein
MRNNRSQFVVKQNFILFNRLNNEQITGDLVNEDEIDGKQFYVLKVGPRMLKLAKDAYTPKRNLLTR